MPRTRAAHRRGLSHRKAIPVGWIAPAWLAAGGRHRRETAADRRGWSRGPGRHAPFPNRSPLAEREGYAYFYFLAASPAGLASPSAASPSAAFSFLAFLRMILTTRTLGNPNGLRPSGHFS